MSRTVRFNLVDVFTDVAFAGNQLAVFTDARALTDAQMQALAAEMGFSECSFVLPPEAGGNARVRIFTPTRELAFAGHPVLGTAYVLGGPMQLGEVVLETGSGLVPVVLERDGALIVFGHMMQPLPSVRPFEREAELLRALGVTGSALPVELYDNGIEHVYVALPSAEAVAGLQPDFAALLEVTEAGANCFHADGATVKTRMFAPADGVPEDAATGSAAGPLALHLARHGVVDWGERVRISQGAELGRPSTLLATAYGSADDGVTAIEVAGSAVVVGRGEIRV
jgi:trans-2,3-dihydro-3-hydroxyanthranilate isomerase